MTEKQPASTQKKFLLSIRTIQGRRTNEQLVIFNHETNSSIQEQILDSLCLLKQEIAKIDFTIA